MSQTVAMNVKISAYASRVLGVVKEKYGLKDKGQALDKMAQLFGEDFVEPQVSEEYVKKILDIEDKHFKRHGHRKMSDRELDTLFEK